MNKYMETVKDKNTLALRELLDKMPPFCTDYFRGIASKAPRTRTGYCRDIYTFLQFITMKNPIYKDYQIKDIPFSVLEDLTSADIDEYLEHLNYYELNGIKYRNDAVTKARKLSALNTMYDFFIKRKMLLNNPINAVERPKVHEKAIITLNQDEIFDLMDLVDNPINLTDRQEKFHEITVDRDRAILSVFLGTGMRISELVGLDLTDIDPNNQSLRVTRKGGNESFVYFGDDVREALFYYLGIEEYAPGDDKIKQKSSRDKLLKENSDEQAVFLSVRGSRMSVRTIQSMVKNYCSMLSTNKKITPHKLRSTYGTALYRETGDIYLVAEVLGHKDVNTTKRHYAQMDNENRRRAANIVPLKKVK